MLEKVRLVSPVDGSTVAERVFVGPEALERAIEQGRRAQRAWAAEPLANRTELVGRALAALRAMDQEAVPELAWMMGRPVRYGGEIGRVEERAGYMTQVAASALATTVIEETPGVRRRIEREPLGVVLVIAPWNYPYLTAINTIVPALIAGNAVLLKHAPQTLLAGERLQRAFEVAGAPPGLFANILADHETLGVMMAAGRFDFVSFTGSVAGGRAVERALAGTFTPLSLELGGKDAAYVMEDANLDAAVEALVDGAMFNSGQSCCGIERIYVAQRLFDRFVEQSAALAQDYVLGNPLEGATTLGPMAHARFAEVVRQHIAEAQGRGARALVDPRPFAADGSGAYVAPQVLVDVDDAMSVMREETFGPVVGIAPVSSDSDAIARINASRYGLTASLWTADVDRAGTIGAELQVGTVFQNRCDYVDPALPWTGRKDSGRGGGLSALAYLSLTRPKAFHMQWGTS